jgi:hypothetical protein
VIAFTTRDGFIWWSDVAREYGYWKKAKDGLFQRYGWRVPGMAIEAAREGWRLNHPDQVFQQDARVLLPVYSNETYRGLCPGFF